MDDSENRKDWESLEILVAKIQEKLAPGAIVQHNVRLPGRDSETERQVDVLVSQNIGQYEMKIAIECKDYKRPVNVKSVEEFHGLVTDIGVQRGAMVCPSGFTRSAKKRARRYNIDLYSPVDTNPHKWQAKVSAPVICDIRDAAISFGIRSSAPKPRTIPSDFFSSLQIYDETGNPHGTLLEIVSNEWNSGNLIKEPGQHDDINVFNEFTPHIDNGHGDRVAVELPIGLRIRQRLYYGNVDISEVSGLKDEHTGGVVTNAFTTGVLNLDEVENTWKRIESVEESPVRPLMIVFGLTCWEA